MRVSKSVVTTRIQQLEDFVGAPLFHRNTRAVRLSEVGQAFLRECSDLVGWVDELTDQMRGLKGSLSGRLRVHALPGFVLGHLAAHLVKFQDEYPDIMLEMVVSDAVVDPVREGFDCALQIFDPVSDELIGRRIFPVRRVFCAAPSYLDKHGVPQHPQELMSRRLGLYSGYPTRDHWVFNGKDKQVALDLKPAMLSNSVHLLNDYACEGAGIVCVPTVVAARALLDGRLKLVLPEWQLSSFWLSAVFPRSHRGGAKLKLFIESLHAAFAGDPPWDRQLIEAGLIGPSAI
jgi:DNA-binding transcriptional LysR family regulator